MFQGIFSEYLVKEKKKSCKEEIEVVLHSSGEIFQEMSWRSTCRSLKLNDVTLDFQFWQKRPYFQEINGIAATLAEELFHNGLLLYFNSQLLHAWNVQN